MSNDQLKLAAPWPEVKEQLMENDVRLTEEDLEYVPGREDELYTRLQHRLGKNKQEIKALIESISTNKGKAG